MVGELKARSPRLTIYDLAPPIACDRKISRGRSSDSSFNSVPGGSTAWSLLSGNEFALHGDSTGSEHRNRQSAAVRELFRILLPMDLEVSIINYFGSQTWPQRQARGAIERFPRAQGVPGLFGVPRSVASPRVPR